MTRGLNRDHRRNDVTGGTVGYFPAGTAPRAAASGADPKIGPQLGARQRALAAVTGETAVAAGKTATREGARYCKLARSRGKAKAQVAVGNTQLKASQLLADPGMRYPDLGPDYYERQAATRRKIAYHVREIEALGLEVTLARIPEPDPDGPASTQAA